MLQSIWEWKQDVTSAPLRKMIDERPEEISDEYMLASLAVAVPTMVMNTLTPLLLIDAGKRGLPMHTSTVFGRFPWETMYEYTTRASRAERIGARIGGRIGSGVMQGIGHATPFVGWFPGGGKLPLSPWIKKAGLKTGAKFGARIGGRLIPGVGWALLAYDVYDLAANRSLWGFDLS